MSLIETGGSLPRYLNSEHVAYFDVDCSSLGEWTLDATMAGMGRSFTEDLPPVVTLQFFKTEEVAVASLRVLAYLVARGEGLITEGEYYAGPDTVVEMDFDDVCEDRKLRRTDRRRGR